MLKNRNWIWAPSIVFVLGGCQAQTQVAAEAKPLSRAEITQKIAEINNDSRIPADTKTSALQSLQAQLETAK